MKTSNRPRAQVSSYGLAANVQNGHTILTGVCAYLLHKALCGSKFGVLKASNMW